MSASVNKVFVFGATGMQGESVALCLMKCGGFQVRGLCRDASKPEAQALKKYGAEIVEADLKNIDVDKLASLMKGCDSTFIVTDFYSLGDKEESVGKTIIDAALKAGIKNVVFSALNDAYKESGGKYRVPHFDQKNHVEDYLHEKKANFDTACCVFPAFYFQNLALFFPPENKNGTYFWKLPNVRLMSFDVRDIGPAVCTILQNPSKWNGKCVPLCGQDSRPDEYVRIFSENTGKKANVQLFSPEEFKKFLPENLANEFTAMFQYFEECGYFGKNLEKNLNLGKELYPNLHSFADFCKEGFDPLDESKKQLKRDIATFLQKKPTGKVEGGKTEGEIGGITGKERTIAGN